MSAGLARQWCAIRSDDDRWGGVRRHVERECVCEVRCVLGLAGDSYYYYSCVWFCAGVVASP